MASADRSMKDKAMAARMKGDGQSTVVASNGVERFTTKANAEWRTTCQCAICHTTVKLTQYDTHLRGHMAGGMEQDKAA